MTQELRKLAKRLRKGQTHDFKTGYLLDQSDVMDESADAIDALLDRLEKSEKDAKRYRWLRERHDESDTQWHVRGHFGSPVLSGQLDTSIDSAMEASK